MDMLGTYGNSSSESCSRKAVASAARSSALPKVTPVIDRTYPFAEIPEAVRYVESGNVQGKVVITV